MNAVSSPPPIELGALVTGLGGGLALFLFGMRQITEALTTVAGAGMKDLLTRSTANRFTAAVAGAAVTALSSVWTWTKQSSTKNETI